MQVKVFGVELTPARSVSLADLWAATAKHSKKQIQALTEYLESDMTQLPQILSNTPLIAIQDYATHYKAGIVLKIRNAKSNFRVSRGAAGPKISAEFFEEGERQIEMNFFLLRADSGKGLYAYYHQSCHMNDFCLTFKAIHEGLLGAKRLSLQKLREDDQISMRDFKLERAKLDSLMYQIMAKSGDAKSMIQNLQKIKKVRIVFSDWEEQAAGEMSPLLKLAKSAATEISFDAETNTSAVKRLLVSTIARAGALKRMRVEGTDAESLDQVINLEKNFDDFNRMDYDQMAEATKELDLSDLAKSWKSSGVLKWLLKTAESAAVVKRLLPT